MIAGSLSGIVMVPVMVMAEPGYAPNRLMPFGPEHARHTGLNR